jgi:ubiquinol-cytochrome c reductase cytochrome c subunit
MPPVVRALFAIFLVLALGGPAALAATGPPRQGVVTGAGSNGKGLVGMGASLYAANCSSCHGADGRGVLEPTRGAGDVSGQGPSLRAAGALAADFYLRTGYMPLSQPGAQPARSRPLFSDHEIRAMVAYVASLGHGPAIPSPEPARGNVATGRRSFLDHCAGCHQIAAQGGFVTGARVPPLSEATDRQIAQAVRIGPYLMPHFSRRQISDGELDSLIAYVDDVRHPADPGGWPIGHVGPVPEGIVAWLLAGSALVATCLLIGRRLA